MNTGNFFNLGASAPTPPESPQNFVDSPLDLTATSSNSISFPSTSSTVPSIPSTSSFVPSFPSTSTFVPSIPSTSNFVPSFPSTSTFVPSFPEVSPSTSTTTASRKKRSVPCKRKVVNYRSDLAATHSSDSLSPSPPSLTESLPSVSPSPTPKKNRQSDTIDKTSDEYRMKRDKNNIAAKKSRDARRAREEQTAWKAEHLELYAIRLQAENEMLKNELKRLQESNTQ
ncbi:DNA-directed RNA polymerase II subunit rpb1-like [Tetranychus urticae]|uniref:BZIP domain-containing protein n=1 Tax=Tetranychus urticae TaxID=32264 RepID=T1JS46_TETUR|nr:DNA-directed RNA polymerase II subunit rpb1-like [Tetranychus urticae]